MSDQQKFHNGDHVRIAKNLGASMSHFQADKEAIVIGSYKDQFGGSDTKSYTLHIKDQGKVSWYYEHQLTLIESNRLDLLSQWEEEATAKAALESDLDWIFANGEQVIKSASSSTVAALAGCTVKDLWGPRGEGFDFYANVAAIMNRAIPFLRAGDKAGWLAYRGAIGDKP